MCIRGLILAAIGLSQVVLAQNDPLGWQAEDAEQQGNLVRAWTLYSQAAALEPNQRKWASKALSLRSPALDAAKIEIRATPQDLPEIDPAIVRAITEEELVETRRLLPPPELKPKPGRQTFNLHGPVRQVIEQTLKTCGIDVVFDSAFNVTRTVKLHLDDASCAEAITSLEMLTGAFLAPITDKLTLVANDTAEKRREQERTAAVTIPLPEPVTVQEAQEAARNVQQLFEIQKFAVDATRRVVLIRDKASKVRMAAMIYHQLMIRRPEVFVEVEFLQVAKQRDTNFGVDLQTMTQIVNFGGLFNSTPPESVTSMFRGFLTFGGGLTLFGLGITDSRVFASMTDSQTRVVQNATLRSLDNQQATLHVGDRFPIITQGYFGGTPTGDEQVFRPPPTIQFEDLGLVLKVTPRVHGLDEVTLNVESEFKVLTGQSINGIPVISNRKFLGQVRLRAGEWAVAAGLMTRQNTKGYTGIAGLAELPLVGTVLRNNSRSKIESDVLLVMKPRIIHPGPAFEMPPPLWVGTETKALPPI